MRRRFDRFYNVIGRNGTRDERGGNRLDRLMMRTIHHELSFFDNLLQEALGCHRHRMRNMDRPGFLTMIYRIRNLCGNVLKEAASARDIDRLHTSTNPQERKVSFRGLVD